MKPHNITDLFSASLADSQLSTKQQAVLKASLKLFSEQGYDRTSTQEIARVAQVSEGTVYKQLKTKEGILRALSAPMINRSSPVRSQSLFMKLASIICLICILF